ncbi:MAG: PH domain-containing protein [Acidobacteriota bacterium]
MTLTGDKLRYEAGVLTKTTRTIQVSKVQDVRVDQSLVQRLSATGDLSIETAGETSQLVVRDIDDPQAVADAITEASQAQPPQQKPPKGAK